MAELPPDIQSILDKQVADAVKDLPPTVTTPPTTEELLAAIAQGQQYVLVLRDQNLTLQRALNTVANSWWFHLFAPRRIKAFVL
jgi:hypothetical protein